MRCFGIFGDGCHRQELYETRSRDAGRRVKQVRALGFRASMTAMGCQLTGVGKIDLGLVDIRPGDDQTDLALLPKVEAIFLL